MNPNSHSKNLSLAGKAIHWLRDGVTPRQKIILIAFLIGVGTAIAAFVLKWLVEEIKYLLTNHFPDAEFSFWYLLFPLVGIMLSALFIRYIVRDDIGHGVTKILFAISRRQSHIKRHNCWSSVIASSLTIGFGGSVGAESPAVLTGSAIGSTLGSFFKVDAKTLMVLVGCGAAGAIAGIFKAPFAGLVFTLEVLMLDLTMASLLPLLVSCVTASVLTMAATGGDPVFDIGQVGHDFRLYEVLPVVFLGVACGLVSLYFTRTTNWLEGRFRRYNSMLGKFAVGGLLLAILIFIFPPLYGEGYDACRLLLEGRADELLNKSFFYGHSEWMLGVLALIMLFKSFASTFTTSAGGCGGLFAPSLFLGCFCGFIFSTLWNGASLTADVPVSVFALLGMAGAMTAIMHAPLTSIFLIAELTGGYALFVPLMLVTVASYLTIVVFERHSIYATRLARRGQLITHHKDRAILTLMSLDNVIDKRCVHVQPDLPLGKLVQLIAKESSNAFPVVDAMQNLRGIIYFDSLRNIVFRQELYNTFHAEQLMQDPPCQLGIGDPMTHVMDRFQATGADVLPVMDASNKFVGLVSQAQLYTAYRQMLVDFSEE